MAPEDRYFWTADNVRLHYRDYAGGDDGRPVLLCLPDLTRNARDFEAFAGHFAPRFRVIAASFRGRGESGYAIDPLTYVPLTYLQDLTLLLDDIGASQFVIVGTGLGAMMGVLLGGTQSSRIRALVMNDYGVQQEEAGVQRLQQMLGRGDNWRSWLLAAREIARLEGHAYPDWTLADWLPHAKRLCRLSREGQIIWDYDPEIAAAFEMPNGEAASNALDLWPALDSYRGKPVLSLRGSLSDVLSADGQRLMQQHLPEMVLVEIPRVGHAPTLAEEQSLVALDGFLTPFLAG